ncbi:UdgX family uracil-DNA binding protein [Iamia sp.]|uniref:UdgX family uracil-DNA binding protein n=1 Tax=Iamia sp. TaxID=2722710 RepID=UPI002CE3C8E0|nr:UdgX family uracil-DNA binding protein [Iamia sp.]HXH57656.1 UdgX family uracil-DNA binding protein [Iamia sp.]
MGAATPSQRWAEVADNASECRRCPLWQDATATVFGEGPVPAEVMLVGEQPGDREDREARPFVGPAGQVLDRCLTEAGRCRDDIYVTNAVKHFKWEARGKRRIHQKPNRTEIEACGPWLTSEIEIVRPRLVMLLGATAAQAHLGSSFRVSAERGRPVESDLAEHVVTTVHPSSILRGPTERRAEGERELVADLRAAFALLAS